MRDLTAEQAAALRAVKEHFGVQHAHFDGWYTNFLENKDFDVAETIAKLHRRHDMERQEFAKYRVTDEMLKSMRSGVLQLLPGRDCDGMPVVYIVTRRDHPKAEERELRTKNLDMWLTYVTRLCEDNKACKVTWLINQKGSSLWSNTDLTFQRTILTRIAKFFPNCQHRLYVCNMSNSLSFVLKPLIHGAPRAISESIVIVSEADVKARKLLRFFDASVLPLELGGESDVDHPVNWERFSNAVTAYTQELVNVLQQGVLDVKTFEMMQAFGTDAAGIVIPKQPETPSSALLLGDTTGTLEMPTTSFASGTSSLSTTKPDGLPRRDRLQSSTPSFRNAQIQQKTAAAVTNASSASVTPAVNNAASTPSSTPASSTDAAAFAALSRSNHEWLQCQADSRHQHRAATVSIMWHRLEETSIALGHVVALLSAASKSRAAHAVDSANTVAGIGWGNHRGEDALHNVGCGCCGLPTHHVTLLLGASNVLVDCAHHALRLWEALGGMSGNAADGTQRLSVHSLLKWALGDGGAKEDGLLSLTCLLISEDVHGHVPSLSNSSNNDTSHPGGGRRVVDATHKHQDASEFFDTMRLFVARSFDALRLLQRALQSYLRVAQRVLGLWVPQVPRGALVRQLQRKAHRQWTDRLVPLLAAYEAHQAAIAILQYIQRQAVKKLHHDRHDAGANQRPKASVDDVKMVDGARNALYLQVHHTLLSKRRLERQSHLFHVFPHWSVAPTDEAHQGSLASLVSSNAWVTAAVDALRSTVSTTPICHFIGERSAKLLQRLLVATRQVKATGPAAPQDDVCGVPATALHCLVAPTTPSLASIVAAYRRRSACPQAPHPDEPRPLPDDAEPCADSNASQPSTPAQLLALVADVDSILHDASEGAHTIRRQLEDRHYRVAHLVERHGCATVLHNALWPTPAGDAQPHASTLLVIDAEPKMPVDDDAVGAAPHGGRCDVPLQSLLEEEERGMLRVVSELPFAIAEFLFGLTAEVLLGCDERLDVGAHVHGTQQQNKCPAPETPEDWQRHLWTHEAAMRMWAPRLQQSQELLDALSHVLQQFSQTAQEHSAAAATNNLNGQKSGVDLFSQFVRTGLPPCASGASATVSAVEHMVLHCALSVSWARLHQQRHDEAAGDVFADSVADNRGSMAFGGTGTQRMPPLLTNDCVVRALLAAETFRTSMQEVRAVAGVYC